MRFLWQDGKEYGLDEFKQRVLEFGEQSLLHPLGRGQAPAWLPLTGKALAHFDAVLGAARKADSKNEHYALWYHLDRLKEMLAVFNRGHYGSSSLTGGASYAVRFGLQCARHLEAVWEGRGMMPPLRKADRGPTPLDSYIRLISDEGSSLPRVKVLLVEDDAALCEMMELILAEAGWRVLRALDGSAGVDLAWRWRPDVILLNFLMPKMDGLTACGRIVDNPRTWTTPVIMHSGLHDPRLVERALRLGACDWLCKPFGADDMVRAVRFALACAAA